ncbi:MAG: radical SAM protein [Sandaracinaceae bacterium]|nr:radical SAM protein [Sandaracinaceae bacterium]
MKATLQPRVFTLKKGATSVEATKKRACRGCGHDVVHTMSGREALEYEPCPKCGQNAAFTSYERVDIALSEYCNLTCQMCRRPSETRFMDEALCKSVITEAAELGIEVISFSGGEPFVHPAIYRLLEHAFSLGVRVQMVSNGTLIKRDKLDFLEQLDCLTISVDGTEEAHDFIRQRKGTWARTMRTLGWLSETKIQWGTNTVMQKDNFHTLYDSFKAIQAIGRYKYSYCGFSHVEVVPETAHFQLTPEQEKIAYEQLVRIEIDCKATHTWFNERELLLKHFEMYSRKDFRYRPIDGCKIPQKFIGFSDHGFYLCWHQGRNIQSDSLLTALTSDLARDIVKEGLEKRCVACNAFNYAWDEEWNQGMVASALAGPSVERGVERGVIALRIPERMKQVSGGSSGNTLDIHDDG